jgi:hypothetical protein
MTRDTVERETPARLAIPSSVIFVPAWLARLAVDIIADDLCASTGNPRLGAHVV